MNIGLASFYGLFIAILMESIDRSYLRGGILGSIFLGVLGSIEGAYLVYFLFDGSAQYERLVTLGAVAGAIFLLLLRKLFSTTQRMSHNH